MERVKTMKRNNRDFQRGLRHFDAVWERQTQLRQAELDAGQPVHVYAYDSLSAYVECDGQRGFAPVKFLKKPD